MDNPSFSIYDASAGSGKTYSLVKEYLKIILKAKKDDAYKHILAITFTNKAVGEMKKRIVDCLHAFSKPTITDQKTQDLVAVLEAETQLNASQIQEKSRRILKNIIHNYASFDISTIDKFTHRILRSFTFDLELPTLFEVSLDTDELLTEAVDEVVAKAGSDDKLTQLLIDYALEKTDNNKSWDISKDIFEMSKLLINENDRKEIKQYKDKSISEFLTINQKLLVASRKIKEECIAIAQQSLQLIESNGIENASFNRSLIPNQFGKIANGTITKYDKTHYLDEGNRYAKTKPQNQKDAIDQIAPELLINLLEINKLSETYLLYDAFLKNIIPLSLLNTISNTLDSIQKEKNILSISEFNAIINKEIQNQPAPFIYERLGERYHHFFIDEFQDTSEMQWQNLIPLIDNALSGENHNGEKGTLLLVGDAKQSIYRWRGGKAEQFIALTKAENPFVIKEKKYTTLDTNYRSYAEVITFNNLFFKTIAAEFSHSDYKDLYENHSAQKTNSKTGGYVTLEFIPYIAAKDVEEEDDDRTQLYLNATRNRIHEVLSQGFAYQDIAILTRKNNNSVAIANHLTEHGIPILSSDSLLLYRSNEVRVLLDVLRYSNNAKNKTAKASFLQYIASNLESVTDVHAFIKLGLQQPTEKEFEQWLSTYAITLSFDDLRQKSIYQSVEICIQNIIPVAKRHAYVQYFCDIILEFDIRKQASINDFFEFWDKKESDFKIPSPEGNNAVQLMSIHKSKGLEFPVVIIPFVDEEIYRKTNKMWLPSTDTSIGLSNILINKSQQVQQFGNSAVEIYESKHQEELLDVINVLYVAFTRAEEQLHIISCMKKNKDGFVKGNTSYFLGHFLEQQNLFDDQKYSYEWGNPQRLSTPQKQNANTEIIQNVTTVFNPSKIKIAQREALLWNTKQAQAIEYGTILHEILAQIKTADTINEAVDSALSSGLITSDISSEITSVLTQIVTHPQLHDFFAPNNTVYNERSILVKNQITIKPDKVVITPKNEALLLDYKTGEPEKKHHDQINQYASVLETMQYPVIKKVLVYIGEVVEVVKV